MIAIDVQTQPLENGKKYQLIDTTKGALSTEWDTKTIGIQQNGVQLFLAQGIDINENVFVTDIDDTWRSSGGLLSIIITVQYYNQTYNQYPSRAFQYLAPSVANVRIQ